MKQLTLQATFGGLLHDIGKPVYRAGGQAGDHSQLGYGFLKAIFPQADWAPVLDCVRYHHASALRSAKAPAPAACLVYIADNLSAAADRREAEGEGSGFRRDLPLSPVFSHLNGEHACGTVPPGPLNGKLALPGTAQRILPGVYQDCLRALTQHLPGLLMQPEWVNSLLTLLEVHTSTFPSSTSLSESPDISLFDHSKTTAAIAACLSEYLLAQGKTDYYSRLVTQEKAFRSEQAFLLYTADFTHIQKFLYTVSTDGALKSLRSRSFFLELLMEHYLDELLTACGVSRANLIYSGGGHCYALLPNTPAAAETVENWNRRFNSWLSEQFGAGLYLAHGYTPCTGNDLTNTPAQRSPYKALFRAVNQQAERRKLHCCTAAELILLNQKCSEAVGRECKVCGAPAVQGGERCAWCGLFLRLSDKIQKQTVCFVSRDPAPGFDFKLPAQNGAEVYASMTQAAAARSRLVKGENAVRVYTKNEPFTGLNYATNLYVGDYAFSNEMQLLADEAQGIRRIAVCRMDVDDLGQAFIAGFEKPGEKDAAHRMRYVTLSRTAAFSRQMSLFFKCYINDILSAPKPDGKKLAVSIVYAGGDDVFLVGAWNDALTAAQRIQAALSAFTGNALTISAGLGLFSDHYPIRHAAAETAALEEQAKEQAGKNSIALFTLLQDHAYSWDILKNKVLGEKLAALQAFFDSVQDKKGMALLYHLLSLLREAETNQINLARYAYALARLEPPKSNPAWAHYRAFTHCMYDWALDKTDRTQLITAIYIYVYLNRKDEH